jgi:hypothetical protein
MANLSKGGVSWGGAAAILGLPLSLYMLVALPYQLSVLSRGASDIAILFALIGILVPLILLVASAWLFVRPANANAAAMIVVANLILLLRYFYPSVAAGNYKAILFAPTLLFPMVYFATIVFALMAYRHARRSYRT